MIPRNALPQSPIGPFAKPRPSMRGRYLIRNALKALAFSTMDAFLSLTPVRRAPLPDRIERILVANWGHLGDVITTFGAISALRARHPGARIGMIAGSWGQAAMVAAGLVDDIYVIDHSGLNRSNLSRAAKRDRFRETRDVALEAIMAADYQVAIDFYPFAPVAHRLFHKLGIPVRVGYTSGGYGPLLTHPVRWADADRPIADHYRALLDALEPAAPLAAGALRPRRSRATLLPRPTELRAIGSYLVLHPGAGAAFKDWGFDHWRSLIAQLRNERPDLTLVLTGAGPGEVAIAEALAEDAQSGIISVAGRVDWEGFVAVVAGATLVVCPDTATGHVAALFDVPVVSIFTGTNSAAQWGPYSDQAAVLVRPVLCAPCNRSGCAAMACIRDVSPEAVTATVQALL